MGWAVSVLADFSFIAYVHEWEISLFCHYLNLSKVGFLLFLFNSFLTVSKWDSMRFSLAREA